MNLSLFDNKTWLIQGIRFTSLWYNNKLFSSRTPGNEIMGRTRTTSANRIINFILGSQSAVTITLTPIIDVKYFLKFYLWESRNKCYILVNSLGKKPILKKISLTFSRNWNVSKFAFWYDITIWNLGISLLRSSCGMFLWVFDIIFFVLKLLCFS